MLDLHIFLHFCTGWNYVLYKHLKYKVHSYIVFIILSTLSLVKDIAHSKGTLHRVNLSGTCLFCYMEYVSLI